MSVTCGTVSHRVQDAHLLPLTTQEDVHHTRDFVFSIFSLGPLGLGIEQNVQVAVLAREGSRRASAHRPGGRLQLNLGHAKPVPVPECNLHLGEYGRLDLHSEQDYL